MNRLAVKNRLEIEPQINRLAVEEKPKRVFGPAAKGEYSFLRPFKQIIPQLAGGVEEMIGTAGSLVEWASDVSPIANTYRAAKAALLMRKLKDPALPKVEKKKLAGEFLKEKEWLSTKAGQWADWWEEQANKGWEAPDPEVTKAKWGEMPISKGAAVISRAAPNYLAAIVSSVLTKSPQTGLLFISGVSGAGAYRRQRKAGTGKQMANAVALLTASWEYVTEKIPFEFVMKGNVPLLKKLMIAPALESAQEFVQGIGENFLEYFGYTAKDIGSVPAAVKEGLEHAMDGWVDNVVAGAGLGLIGGAVVPRAGMEKRLFKTEELPLVPKEEIVPEPAKEVITEKPLAVEPKVVEPTKVGVEKRKVYYHGSQQKFKAEDIDFGKGILREGIYLSESPKIAETYGKTIHKYTIRPNAKILDLSSGEATLDFVLKEGILEREDIDVDLERYILEGRIFQYDPYNRQGIIDDIMGTAREKGYDVVKFFDDLGGESDNIATVVVNKEVLAPVAPPTQPVAEKPAEMPEHELTPEGRVIIETDIGQVQIPEPMLTGKYGEDLETIVYYGNFQSDVPQPNLQRSLSVGDTVKYKGHTLMIMSFGWRDVTGLSDEAIDAIQESPNALPTAAEWRAAEKRLKAAPPTQPVAEKPVVEKPPAKAKPPPTTKEAVPEKPIGLTRDELAMVDRETAAQMREAQMEGLKIGYKLGDKQARTQMKASIVELRAEKKISKETRVKARQLIQKAFRGKVPKKLLTVLTKTNKKEDINKIIDTVSEVLDKIDQRQALGELKVVSKDIKSRIGKTMQKKGIRPEYAKKLNTLIDSFATRKISQWRLKDIGSLKNYLSSLKEGISNDASIDEDYRARLAESLIPERRLNLLNKLSESSIHLLRAEDIRTVTAELKRLVHLNDTKNKIYLARTAREAADYLSRALKEQKQVPVEKKVVEKETLAPTQKKIRESVWGYVGGVHNFDVKTLANAIEGGKDGAVAEVLVENLRHGRRVESEHKVRIYQYIRKFLAQNNITPEGLKRLSPAFQRALRGIRGQEARRLFGAEIPRYTVKIAGKTKKLTMAEMMSVYMHAQADFNLKAMFKEGIASITEEIGALSPEELAVIVNKVKSDKTALALTRMYAHIAENINKPAINEVSMDLKGIEIADVENYFTVERYAIGKLPGNQQYQINLLESQGFLQERTGSKNPLVIRDFFSVLMANVEGVSEYVGMAKPFRAAHTILSYKPWAKAVDSKGHKEQRRHLNTIISRTEQKPRYYGKLETLFSKALRGVTRAVLANPGIMAGQLTSEINYAATDIPNKYLQRNPVPTKAEVERACSEFPWMWARKNLGVSSIATRDVSRTDAALRAFTGKKEIINLPTAGIAYVDMKAITFGRQCCEDWVADTTNLKKGTPEFIEEVNKRAHRAISESQPMFETENRSVLTSTPNMIAKSFVLFRSYIDQTLRILARANVALKTGKTSQSQRAAIFGIIFAGFAVHRILRILVDALIFGRKREPYEIAKDIALSPLRALNFVGFPLQRAVGRMIDVQLGKMPKTRYFDTGFESLAISSINEAWNAGNDFAMAAAYLGTDVKYKSGPNKGRLKSEVMMQRAVEKLAYSIGKLYGLPTPAVQKARYGWLKKEEPKKGRKSLFRKRKKRSLFRKAG